MRKWAGSGKLTRAQWMACYKAKNYREVAQKLGVCKETVQRIAAGRSWKEGWKPRTLVAVDETKTCVVCGKVFTRRFPNGRRRTPAMWDRKRTCCNSCNVTLMWQEGVYAHR